MYGLCAVIEMDAWDADASRLRGGVERNWPRQLIFPRLAKSRAVCSIGSSDQEAGSNSQYIGGLMPHWWRTTDRAVLLPAIGPSCQASHPSDEDAQGHSAQNRRPNAGVGLLSSYCRSKHSRAVATHQN